jgi:hypothetical protein
MIDYSKIEEIDFNAIKFLNTSFRELSAIVDGRYIVRIYSFVVQVSVFHKPFIYEKLKFYDKDIKDILRVHHGDFTDGFSKLDPCNIFEDIYGIRIHHGESDIHLMNKTYLDEITLFESDMISSLRERKINQIIV